MSGAKSGSGISSLPLLPYLVGVWLWHVPTAGYAITAMAGIASIMALRPDMRGREKFLWLFVLFVYMGVEIRAINHDQIDRNAKFEAIADGLKKAIETGTEAISLSQEQFKETTSQASAQFDATMNRAQENLNHMTGGDTYPLIDPIFIPVENTQNTFRLNISAMGSSPLFDINVSLSKLPLPTTPISATDFVSGKGLPHITTLFVAASLSPNRAELLPSVTVSDSGQSDFLITTLARNGVFHERLHIRKVRDTFTREGKDLVLPWEWSCEITRDKAGRDKRTYPARVTTIPWQKNIFANGQVTQQR
jgi:hypothetical protein